MKTTIDAAGRLVIPKEIRQTAGIAPGTTVEICFDNGYIEIEPVALPVKLVWRGHLLVAVPEMGIHPLSSEIVEATRETLQHERGIGG